MEFKVLVPFEKIDFDKMENNTKQTRNIEIDMMLLKCSDELLRVYQCFFCCCLNSICGRNEANVCHHVCCTRIQQLHD